MYTGCQGSIYGRIVDLPIVKKARLLNKRYVNAFGFNEPVSSVSMMCAINSPKKGLAVGLPGHLQNPAVEIYICFTGGNLMHTGAVSQ
jgi:hypothetical protein